MALETLTGITVYLNSLVNTNPTSSDNKSEGDDHIRGIKNVLLNSFPGITGAVTSTHAELNILDGVTATAAEINTLDGVTATTAQINKLVQIIVPGAVTAYAGSVVPTGWLECNGSAVSRTVYSDLYSAIGTTYGVGDGSTTFNLPDLRGEFIRGYDNSRGVDSGRALGSYQADNYPAHTHNVTYYNANAGIPIHVSGTSGTTPYGSDATSSSGSGTETRPRNVAMMYIIKY